MSRFSPEYTRFIRYQACRVGFVVVRPEDGQLTLDHLYIAPDWQGRGFGGRILQWVFQCADEQGLDVVVTALRGSDSNRFYQRHGFRHQSESDWDINYRRSPVPR